MKGDFLGFSFDGIHSSSLGITRVSDGDRYSESLVPELTDRIVEIPGEDGSYYFGSNYTNKPFTLSIAFDSMTEMQFRLLRKLFGTKKICNLIFDERPYKVYKAKIAVPIQLNYICFDEEDWHWESENHEGYIPGSINHKVYTGNRRRIYKGEGSIEFICTYPYALSQFDILEYYGDFDFESSEGIKYKSNPRTAAEADERYEYDSDPEHLGPYDNPPERTDNKYAVIGYGNRITTYNNIADWAESSGILPYKKYLDHYINQVCQTVNNNLSNYHIPVYNPGDVDTPFYLFLPFDNSRKIEPINNELGVLINMGSEYLILNTINSKSDSLEKENGIIINTYNHLIEGVLYDHSTGSWRTTGNLYNECIVKGDFAKIKCQDWTLDNLHDPQQIYLGCTTAANAIIHYNYLYY